MFFSFLANNNDAVFRWNYVIIQSMTANSQTFFKEKLQKSVTNLPKRYYFIIKQKEKCDNLGSWTVYKMIETIKVAKIVGTVSTRKMRQY